MMISFLPKKNYLGVFLMYANIIYLVIVFIFLFVKNYNDIMLEFTDAEIMKI